MRKLRATSTEVRGKSMKSDLSGCRFNVLKALVIVMSSQDISFF